MRPPPPPGVTEFPDVFDPPFHRALAIRMGHDDDHRGIAWIHVDPDTHYGAAWAHGGVVAALVDIASGIAIASRVDGDRTSVIEGTIELKVNYLRKVVEGDLIARAQTVHVGKRVAVTEVDIVNLDRLVAKGVATFMLREPRT